jgi:hypothetical protein
MRKGLDPPFIAPSNWRTTLVRLIIVGAIIIIVPLIAAFTLNVISLLVAVLDPAACISIANDIP